MSVPRSGSWPRERATALRPAAVAISTTPGAAFGMARRHDRQQAGKALPQAANRIDDDGFLARMGRGGGDHRALAHHRADRGELAGIDRRRRHVELEIAGHADARRAELGIALGVRLGLREAEIEAAEHRADGRAAACASA